ncbi:MAG: hypothetical protein J6E42_03910 [Firmicutes bacterium]|nr:hypothetical protein [Bacillota bacterium]
MKVFKQAGVCVGAVLGGTVGGAVSLAGKLTGQQEIDQLGENIVDSAILTGEIAGHALSGTADVITGAVRRDKEMVKTGGRDLKRAGGALVKNVAANASVVVMEAGNVVIGVKTGDRARVIRGLKTMGKMAAIEFLTVGAIKMDTPDRAAKPSRPAVTVVRIVPSGPATARVFPTQEEIDAQRRVAVAAGQPRRGRFWSQFFR